MVGAGRGLGHQGARARRHLLRLGRCGRASWPASPSIPAGSSCCCPRTLPAEPSAGTKAPRRKPGNEPRRRQVRPGGGRTVTRRRSRAVEPRCALRRQGEKPSRASPPTRRSFPLRPHLRGQPRRPPNRASTRRAPKLRPAARAKSARPPPLAEFDRRAVRQVASGKVEIDARLDLHGMRQRDARTELHAFLLRRARRGPQDRAGHRLRWKHIRRF